MTRYYSDLIDDDGLFLDEEGPVMHVGFEFGDGGGNSDTACGSRRCSSIHL